MATVDFLIAVFLVALFAAFILSLAYKWGFIEWLQVHGINSKKDSVNDLFSKWASCNFCLSWWIGVVLSVLAALIVGDWHLLCVPFFSAVITKHII